MRDITEEMLDQSARELSQRLLGLLYLLDLREALEDSRPAYRVRQRLELAKRYRELGLVVLPSLPQGGSTHQDS